ncbi:SRPBCC domain-containing protein [Yoonia sp. 208BN28-4]|uniref:SRPBCC domain-containing protein n=1 Tax=Yoonia sp. 208BN28-4 TaxID=3126505 RepID=UPI0030B188C2
MMTPIAKTVTVPLSPEDAFRLFFADIARWWPLESHSVSGKSARLTVEPHKNGLLIERGPDGSEHIWGTIIGWEDGKYAAFSWHPGRSEDEATVVTVSFKPGADGCVVDLTHGGFDILGDTADAVSRSYLTGWNMVLGCYCSAVTQVHTPA